MSHRQRVIFIMSFGVQSISRHSFSMVSVVTGFPSLNFCRVQGSEAMETGMTNAEFNAFLETLAQLVESKAKTVQEAAALIRQAQAK